MNETYLNFGEFIVAKRTAKGISLRKMAEIVGLSAPFWSAIEKVVRILRNLTNLSLSLNT